MYKCALAPDEGATRQAVAEYIEEVRLYRQIGFVRRESNITQGYSPREHGSTNKINKQTERIAIWNVDMEAKLQRQDEELMEAMSRLNSKQREIIHRSYLDDEGEFDYISCGEMGLSDSTFRRIKKEAIFILATRLRLLIWSESEKQHNVVS
ncbi:ArpU family phage packaging/lysis transcriptional regulator [Paenibacillus kandeliae]|uniref:ArpU family phage packaging/lysis transcriptional regulator n=1 Tax=Paenibacillus kandeliae TaxID=3231269 RepID=UPI00345AFB15